MILFLISEDLSEICFSCSGVRLKVLPFPITVTPFSLSVVAVVSEAVTGIAWLVNCAGVLTASDKSPWY